MKNTNLTTKKIKEMFQDPVVRTVVVSFITMIVVLGIIIFFVWHYRGTIYKLLASDYNAEMKQSSSNATISYPAIGGENQSATQISSDMAKQDSVVSAVKTAKPAVVSIVESKTVPKYSVSYGSPTDPTDPFGNLFPGFFQTPIYTPNGSQKQQVASGSGFIISPNGLIVTNKHVVADTNAEYEVFLNNGKSYPATVLARDGVLDVAFVKIDAVGLPFLNLGDSDTLDVGQTVIAIGNALGEFKNTVSVGVVSGLSRSITAGDQTGQSEQLDKVIQTDAAINPGNSGGPLLDLAGDVIGINVAVVQGSSNIGFALPINSLKSAVNSVKATGKIIRPYLGIRYVTINSDLQTKNNLPINYGILVQRGATSSDLAVIPGSPADKAGIVENDIILSIDEQKIDENFDFSAYIRGKNIGDTVTLTVLSKGVQKTVTVKLEAAPNGM